MEKKVDNNIEEECGRERFIAQPGDMHLITEDELQKIMFEDQEKDNKIK